MRLLPSVLLAAACVVWATAASAQRRSVNDVVVVAEAQVEVALKGDDYLLAALNLVAPTSGSGGTFAGGQLRLGYEHFWNSNWSWGATARVLAGGNDYSYGDVLGLSGNVVPGLLLRHRGQIGAFNFGQRLAAERAITVVSGKSFVKDRSLLRLRFDVDREFALGEKTALRPRLAYELAAHPRLQRDMNDTKERVVDFGSLRGEVGVRLSPRLDLTPWAAIQTHYLNTLPQFDAFGQQTGGGRTNLVTPQVGLDVRLTLGRPDAAGPRQQLPTQH